MKRLVLTLFLLPFSTVAGMPEAQRGPASAQQLCAEFRDCNHLNAESTTKCLKDALINVGLTKKRLGGQQARKMGKSLVSVGFRDEGLPNSSSVPEGAVLIVQPRRGCAGNTGTILLKCSGEWTNGKTVAVSKSCPRKVFVHPDLQQ